MEIINIRKIRLLIKEQQKLYENAKICYISKEQLGDKYAKDKNYRKVRGNCHYAGEYRGAAHNICNLKYSEPKEISIVFHNGLTMIIIKE